MTKFYHLKFTYIYDFPFTTLILYIKYQLVLSFYQLFLLLNYIFSSIRDQANCVLLTGGRKENYLDRSYILFMYYNKMNMLYISFIIKKKVICKALNFN